MIENNKNYLLLIMLPLLIYMMGTENLSPSISRTKHLILNAFGSFTVKLFETAEYMRTTVQIEKSFLAI